MKTPDPLYLLDGYGLIYRSYFAFIHRPLRNAKGENTSAVFGFFRNVLGFLKKEKPKYFAVVFDSKTPTFRHEMYEAYKATREKTPEDLHAQVPVIERICEALGMPLLRRDGFEADDVIATLAERAAAEGRPCFVMSGDKDLLQLVRDGITVLKPDKGDFLRIGSAEVVEQWGVRPDQIVDCLALMGDSSDNIPGVDGIGPKTAAALLAKAGTLDALYERPERYVTKSQLEKLAAGKESAFVSRTLATLRRDVPGDWPLESLTLKDLNGRAAAPLFLEQGMKDLASEVAALGKPTGAAERNVSVAGASSGATAGAGGEPGAAEGGSTISSASASPGVYHAVTTIEDFEALCRRLSNAGRFAFDSETTGLDEISARPVGFSFALKSGEGWYAPLRADGKEILPEGAVKEKLKALLGDPKNRVIGQNIKFDYKILSRWVVDIASIDFDTMVAAWLLEPDYASYGMDAQAEKRLGYRTIHYNEVVAKDATFDSVPLDTAVRYAAEDADITYRLFEDCAPRLEEQELGKLFRDLEMPLVRVLADMELRGVGLRREALIVYGMELEKQLFGIEFKIHKAAGRDFNIASTQQLQEVLFRDLGYKPVKKTKTGQSTDTSVLEELALADSDPDSVPNLLLTHRTLSKLKSTYVDSLPALINPDTGRLHTHYVQTGTATGRLSSKNPNLQNIPVKTQEGLRIRSAFVASPGRTFVGADYSQIELVILAHLSGDPTLLESFRQGRDVHRHTASLIFGTPLDAVSDEERRLAKTINFGIMYGMSAFRLSRDYKLPMASAKRFIDEYFQRYGGVQDFISRTVASAEEKGYVSTLLGRKRWLPAIGSRNRTEKAGAERIAVNTPIQGSAADIIKLAMIRIDGALGAKGLATRLILQVHDELILEGPVEEKDEAGRVLRTVMEEAYKLSIPVRVDLESGANWGDMG